MVFLGQTIRTTEDVIEAPSIDAAEAKAIELWSQVEPRYTYRPLIALQHV